MTAGIILRTVLRSVLFTLLSPYYYPYWPLAILQQLLFAIRPYYSYRHNIARSELKQYLIDFENGKILEYDVNNAEMLYEGRRVV